MAQLPSMDEILASGQKRESRSQIVLGAILLGGGLAFLLGMQHIGWGGRVPTFGAIGLGAGYLLRGLFGGSR